MTSTTQLPAPVSVGRSDLTVSPLCLGTNVFGWTVDEPGAHAVLDAFVAAGGNFIDTADIYRDGTSERYIGSWLAARPGAREELVIATKVGMRMPGDRAGLAPDYIREACAASLDRLGVEQIDLYYAHTPDPAVDLLESLRAFDELQRSGQIRAYALSNYDAAGLRRALDLCDAHDLARPVALQPHYNLVHRDSFEGELQQLCVEEQIAVAPYYGLAAGFLTGKYRRDAQPPASDRAEAVLRRYDNDGAWAMLDAVLEVASRHDATPAQVALAWLATRDAVVAPIASATNVSQLEELMGAFRLVLTAEDRARLAT